MRFGGQPPRYLSPDPRKSDPRLRNPYSSGEAQPDHLAPVPQQYQPRPDRSQCGRLSGAPSGSPLFLQAGGKDDQWFHLRARHQNHHSHRCQQPGAREEEEEALHQGQDEEWYPPLPHRRPAETTTTKTCTNEIFQQEDPQQARENQWRPSWPPYSRQKKSQDWWELGSQRHEAWSGLQTRHESIPPD